MEKGYSKLMIWDEIVLNVRPPPHHAVLNWVMFTTFAGRKRTESEWKALIESEDVLPRFRMTGFWYYSKNDQRLVERDLAY